MSHNASASLPRVLGSFAATALVVGTVLGSGIFFKPSTIAGKIDHFGVVALLWIAGGLLTFLGALAYAEVASVLPRSGGNYVFLSEGYGRVWGFLWGWVDFLIIRAASIAALATAFSASLADLLRLGGNSPTSELAAFWARIGLTLGVLILLAWVNIRGVRLGGGLQVLITLVKVGTLLFLLVLPWAFFAASAPGPSTENLRPIWPENWSGLSLAGLGSAFLGILWAYHGWGNIAPAAGEIKNPQRNIPLSLLAGIGIIVFLYLGVNLAYYLVMPGSEMKAIEKGSVASAVGFKLLGTAGLTFAALAIMFSTFGALNGNILVGPRLLFAMGRDGLVPRTLGHVHPRYQTPDRAITVLTAWSCLLVVGVGVLLTAGVLDPKKNSFDRLTDFAMFGAVTFETLAVLAIFALRRTHPHVERPYKCPGYPWVPLLYVVLPVFVLFNMVTEQPTEAFTGVGIIAAGVVFYFALGLHRVPPAPAPETPAEPEASS